MKKKDPLADPIDSDVADEETTPAKSTPKNDDSGQAFWQKLKGKTSKRISASSHKSRSAKSTKKPNPFMKASAK